MRIAFGAIVILLLVGAPGRAQVINGEGNFESNRGFDRAPGDAPSNDGKARPAQGERMQDDRQER